MALFFLVVGLEANRKLDLGELRERTRLWIPIAAALGGMIVPIGLYLLVNAGGDGAGGWGVAMSSDTALALGALALAAPSGSTRLRVFLLTLAVVDDLGALVVIVVAYTSAIDVKALVIAAGLFAVLALLRFLPSSRRGPVAVVVEGAIWVAMFESGVDPVIAGLAIGLVTAAYPPGRHELERATDLTREFREQPTPGLASSARRSLAEAISPSERLQYALHPWASYVIVPLFALANAGVHLTGDLLSRALTSPITIGIVLAFVIGKPPGITAASWVATRRMLGGARLSVTWPGLVVTGSAAGVGFTVSFLIASLALTGVELDEAKIGVLAAAVISPLLAVAVFRGSALIPDTRRLEQLRRTAESIIDLADDVDPEQDHVRGDPDGAVTLLEYADFDPVLRPGGADHPPPARGARPGRRGAGPALRVPSSAAQRRAPARAARRRGLRGRSRPGRVLADARRADGEPGRVDARRPAPLCEGSRPGRRSPRGRGRPPPLPGPGRR